MKTFSVHDLRLERPDSKYKDSYLAAMAELQTEFEKTAWVYLGKDEPHDTPAKDFETYVLRLRSMETEPLPNFVKTNCYWSIYKDDVVGRIAIRGELNEDLSRVGGHIGYIVRPSFRQMGVATEMLRQILETEQARAIGKVLLTCREDNIASEKTITRNGGVLESIVPDGAIPNKKRFWIDLSSKSGEIKPTGLIGGTEKRKIEIVDYDPLWPAQFQTHVSMIAEALGESAIQIEHIGSTSVPGLAAKSIIDIVVAMQDSTNEDSYLPQLQIAGYELRVREPDWFEHRMFRTPARDVHIHVFSVGCPEIDRCLMFRNRLRENARDCLLYEQTKRKLATQEWADMNEYAKAKTAVIESIVAAARADASHR
jgi:GrpB-like predicted nucleotidyltransferase (UPF0157 family)/predicted acetyltransferase